jgi:phage portal protein BeeE
MNAIEQMSDDLLREGKAYGLVVRDTDGNITSITYLPASEVLEINNREDNKGGDLHE